MAAKVIGLSSNGGSQGRFFGYIGLTEGVLNHFFVSSSGLMVPLELLIRAQERKDGLFQNVVAEIDQCEEDEISHVPMMKQRKTFVNLPFPYHPY